MFKELIEQSITEGKEKGRIKNSDITWITTENGMVRGPMGPEMEYKTEWFINGDKAVIVIGSERGTSSKTVDDEALAYLLDEIFTL